MSDSSKKQIALSKLPSGGDILVGRESELALLDKSLASESTHVVSIVAWGGTGKSALADHWMNGVAAKNWPGIDRYFDWSFYSQGTRGEQGTSADLFIAEAVEPMRASIEMTVSQNDWKNASIYAGNLSELELTLGDIGAAIVTGERIIEFTGRSKQWGVHWDYRCSLADALHQGSYTTNEADHAHRLFVEAEATQATQQPNYPLLYSTSSFQYADLLLSNAERASWGVMCGVGSQMGGAPAHGLKSQTDSCKEVVTRVTQTVAWVTNAGLDILTGAMGHLTLARAALYLWLLGGSDQAAKYGDSGALGPYPRALIEHLTPAVAGLRAAGSMNHLPRGLLTGDTVGAIADLDEAWEIAERGPMPLYQADILLTRARLFFRDDLAKAWEDLNEAKRLVNKHGYHRRDEEIADAEEAFRIWGENHPASDIQAPTQVDDNLEEPAVVRDQVFVSYSRKDKKYMEELKVHLKPYKLPKWIDTDIRTGANWKEELQAAVKKTRVAVFLVSPDSLASDFINNEELGPLVAAKEAGEVTIVWVQLRACAIEVTPFKGIQSVVSPPGKPVAGLSPTKRDAVWLAVSREVKKALGDGDAD